MPRLVLMLIAAALLLSVGCAGGHHGPSAAALRHHYFLVGKRVCSHLLRQQDGTASVFAINTNRYPAKYRKTVAAGCKSAGV
jgi:hypothetical protein